jgi:DNA-directed RNA polymerase subunit RPC12/RpoP
MEQPEANVVCDECRRSFPWKATREKQGDIEIDSLVCPHCKHKIFICKTNPKTRELRRKIEKLRRQIRNKREHGIPVVGQVTRLTEMVEKHAEMLRELNKK